MFKFKIINYNSYGIADIVKSNKKVKIIIKYKEKKLRKIIIIKKIILLKTALKINLSKSLLCILYLRKIIKKIVYINYLYSYK